MKLKKRELLATCEHCGFYEIWLKGFVTHDPIWYDCPVCGEKMLKPGYDPYEKLIQPKKDFLWR